MSRFTYIAVLAVLLSLLAPPVAALAITWDVPGAIPPSQTSPPHRPDPLCEQSYANERPRGGPALHFGIGPRLSGDAGTINQTPVVAEDPAQRDRALRRLKGHKTLSVRLNRLFESDGEAGIRRFQRLATHFARQGIDVELQVRYHPRPADNGNIAKWLRYVRRVVRAFGANHHVVALQITNEVNLTFSPNTSDGYWKKADRALTEGVVAAKRESLRHRFFWQKIGFNFVWRLPDHAADARFWREVGRRGGDRLRRATDYVGLDIYPGLYAPGIFTPGAPPVKHLGDAYLEGLAQVRECYMPLAGFGRRVPLRIDETGFPTGPDRPDEAAQARALTAIVRTTVAYRWAYHITHLNWFSLRDNTSHGPDFQSFYGLLHDDYRPKPAFDTYRRLIARYGARAETR